MSIYEPMSEWSHVTAGGIRYKLVEGYPKGTFDEEHAEVEEQYIIHRANLEAFAQESFPAPTVWEDLFAFSQKRRYPGSNSLVTKSVSWEPFEPGRPSDPYSIDPTAPSDTYSTYLRLTIKYETQKQNDVDPNDPETFLEILADASGEFLILPVRGADVFFIDPDATENPAIDAAGDAQHAPVKGPAMQMPFVMPTTDWTVRWPHVARDFVPTLVARMRPLLGKVNSVAMPILQNAAIETILFMGYSFREEYTWRTEPDQKPTKPPAEITMKFSEKHIERGGKVIGHNHVWKEEDSAFRKLQVNGGNIYESADLNTVFTG